MNSNKSAVLFAVVFLSFTSLVGYAPAQETKHPLDVWFANCVAQDDSTEYSDASRHPNMIESATQI